MSTVEMVPNSLLKALTRTYGARMVKKVRETGSFSPMHGPIGREYTPSSTGSGGLSHSGYTSLNGMFESDFFYWYGGAKGSNTGYSLCRTCRTVCFGYTERTHHMARAPIAKDGRSCAKLLLEALELLRQDKKCAICNKKTLYLKYGVYLCSTDCEDRWRYNPVPENLKAAFQLIGYNDDL